MQKFVNVDVFIKPVEGIRRSELTFEPVEEQGVNKLEVV